MRNIGTTLHSSLLLSVSLLSIAGCNADKSSMASFFPPNDGNRRVDQFIETQTNLGVRQDATLQAYHFDGKHLNSLGLEKLDRMIPDEPNTELVVYLNLADSPLSTARKDDVVAYLEEAGLDADLIKIENGVNPDSTSPTAPGLSQLAKTESEVGSTSTSSKSSMK